MKDKPLDRQVDILPDFTRPTYKDSTTLQWGTLTQPYKHTQTRESITTLQQPYAKGSEHLIKVLASIDGADHLVGEWWHTLLAQLHTVDEVDEVLNKYVQTDRLTRKQAQVIWQTMQGWWQHPLLKDWFSGAWNVKIEASILLPNGHILRPDRVMLQGKHAVVLDFKTGKCLPAHALQLQGYARHLQKIGYLPVQAYLFYTTSNELVAC